MFSLIFYVIRLKQRTEIIHEDLLLLLRKQNNLGKQIKSDFKALVNIFHHTLVYS